MKYGKEKENYIAEFASADPVVLENVSQDEVDLLDDTYQLFLSTMDNIRAAVEGGLLSEDEGRIKQAEAVEEYKARIAAALDVDELEYDDEDEDASYSYGDDFNIANFEAGSNFGQAVLELAKEEYEDPLDALVDIADEYGLTDEQVVGLINGAYAPDAELAQAIGSFFETTAEDEDAYIGLMVLAQEAQEEILEGGEGDDDEYYGYDDDDDEDEYDDEGDNEDEEASYKLAELEDKIANFEAASIIDATLSEFESEAERGFREGWLTPKVKRVLMGNFRSAQERLANFSETCDVNQITPEMQLYAIDYALKTLEAAGPIAKFGAYVEEDIDDDSRSVELAAEQQARLNFQLMKESF